MDLPSLPADKANHALYGALIFMGAGALAVASGHAQIARPVGAGVAVLCGVLKELVDWGLNRSAIAQHLPPPHEAGVADALATSSGALLCWVAAIATGG